MLRLKKRKAKSGTASRKLHEEAYYELIRFRHDPYHPEELRDPDSVLLTIKEMLQKEPDLKYAPIIAF